MSELILDIARREKIEQTMADMYRFKTAQVLSFTDHPIARARKQVQEASRQLREPEPPKAA